MVRVPALRFARHTAASPDVPHQFVSIPVTVPSLPNAYLNHMAGPEGLAILGIEGRLIEEVIARHPVGSHGGRGEGIGLLNDILEDIIHSVANWVGLSA